MFCPGIALDTQGKLEFNLSWGLLNDLDRMISHTWRGSRDELSIPLDDDAAFNAVLLDDNLTVFHCADWISYSQVSYFSLNLLTLSELYLPWSIFLTLNT